MKKRLNKLFRLIKLLKNIKIAVDLSKKETLFRCIIWFTTMDIDATFKNANFNEETIFSMIKEIISIDILEIQNLAI